MNDDLQTLVKELQEMDVQLPLHKKALRERILEVQSRRRLTLGQRARRVIWSSLAQARDAAGPKKVLSIGAVIIVASVLLVGLLILLPISSQGPAKKRLAEAAEKVKQLPPEKVAEVSKQYNDLNNQVQGGQTTDNAPLAMTSAANLIPSEAAPKNQSSAASSNASGNQESPTVAVNLGGGNDPLLAIDVGDILPDRGHRDDAKDKKDKREKDKKDKDSNGVAQGLIHRSLRSLLD